MSDRKSLIKSDVIRKHFPDSVKTLPVDECPTRDPFPVWERNVTTIIEDSAVKWNQFQNLTDDYELGKRLVVRCGSDLVEFMTRGMKEAFVNYPSVHTYIMVFDKHRFVPTLKASTQTKRTINRAEQNDRAGVPEWHYDPRVHASPLISYEGVLPPWPRLLENRALSKMAMQQMMELILTHVRLPRGKRLILDGEFGPMQKYKTGETIIASAPWCLEACENGVLLEPFMAVELANSVGEADACVQWYVDRLSHPEFSVDPLTPDVLRIKSVSNGPIKRAEFRNQDIVLRSTDTDFYPFSVLHRSRHMTKTLRFRNRVILALGTRAHVNPDGDWCTSNKKNDPTPVWEFCDVNVITEAIIRLFPTPETGVDNNIIGHRLLDFAAFTAVCGNDYVQPVGGINRSTSFSVFKRWASQDKHLTDVIQMSRCPRFPDGPRIARFVPCVLPTAFLNFIKECYCTHMAIPEETPKLSYLDVAQITADKYKRAKSRRAPVGEAALDKFRRVWWSVYYMSGAPYGMEYVADFDLLAVY